MSEIYYYSLAFGPLEIATTISTASKYDFEIAICLIYVLPENVCEVWELNSERKDKFTHFAEVLAKNLLKKTTQPIVNKNGFWAMKKKKTKSNSDLGRKQRKCVWVLNLVVIPSYFVRNSLWDFLMSCFKIYC